MSNEFDEFNMRNLYCVAMLVSDTDEHAAPMDTLRAALRDRLGWHAFQVEPECRMCPRDLQEWLRDAVEREGDSPLVVLTWHPGLIDCFSSVPDHVFTWDGQTLCRLTDLRDRDWLSHFRLGQLYWNGEFDKEAAK